MGIKVESSNGTGVGARRRIDTPRFGFIVQKQFSFIDTNVLFQTCFKGVGLRTHSRTPFNEYVSCITVVSGDGESRITWQDGFKSRPGSEIETFNFKHYMQGVVEYGVKNLAK